jgi:hypothetical protein
MIAAILSFSFAGCGTKANWDALYKDAVGAGYTDTVEAFTSLLLGEGGDKKDEGNKGLSAYEIFAKYHLGYEGDEETFLSDLAEGKLKDLDGLVMQVGSVLEKRIKEDYIAFYPPKDKKASDVRLYDQCGIYNGSVVAMIKTGFGSWFAIRQESIAGVRLWYPTLDFLKVWHTGDFYTVGEAYLEGFLTR